MKKMEMIDDEMTGMKKTSDGGAPGLIETGRALGIKISGSVTNCFFTYPLRYGSSKYDCRYFRRIAMELLYKYP